MACRGEPQAKQAIMCKALWKEWQLELVSITYI